MVKMIQGLGICHVGAEFAQPAGKRLRGDLLAMLQYLKDCYKGDRDSLCARSQKEEEG